MLYFTLKSDKDEIKIPLSCIVGLSYTKSGNIVDTSNLSCRCLGINPLQVNVQILLNSGTCMGDNFLDLARDLSQIKPTNTKSPYSIFIADDILLPQLQFMITSVNTSFQSDRLGNLQEMGLGWILSSSRVIKDENRNTELKADNINLLPKIVLHCKGKSITCAQDISISDCQISGFKGTISLILSDSYMKIARDSWLVDIYDDPDAHITIDGYGKYYFTTITLIDNWLTLSLTKFPKEYYQQQTKTLLSPDDKKIFTLKDIFDKTEVKSKAQFYYYKYDARPIDVIYTLQDSLGYLIGLRNDEIVLYDPPKSIPSGNVTYDYVLDTDMMTFQFSKVILRNGTNEYTVGDDSGETWFANTICRVDNSAANRILDYLKFNQNMITLTIPLEKRINIGSIININTGDSVLNCVCTEYDIDFMNNSMQIELHYLDR